MSVVVKVENVSKRYNLGKTGTNSLKGDFQRWWARKRGKVNPFASVVEPSQIQEEFWALKDINFNIQQGEVIGIIGKNGAGKSTLLKILSRITLPTTGSIKVKGRIASLLEVGTGFNPDLTGRENTYLNGAILGMTKAEITKKFDEIIHFSGIERFIDTPVKRYSSGMYVRLAFAVAAHLESEILILDEVLAVGDAEFQRKCLSKMDDVAHKQGRTILFVSHSMSSVQKLCDRGILLEHGKIKLDDTIEQVAGLYEKQSLQIKGKSLWINNIQSDLTQSAYIKSIDVLNEIGIHCDSFYNSDNINLRFTVFIKELDPLLTFGFDIIKKGELLFRSQHIDNQKDNNRLRLGENTFDITIPRNILNVGEYQVVPLVSLYCIKGLSVYQPTVTFNVTWNTETSVFHKQINEVGYPGLIFPILYWHHDKNHITI